MSSLMELFAWSPFPVHGQSCCASWASSSRCTFLYHFRSKLESQLQRNALGNRNMTCPNFQVVADNSKEHHWWCCRWGRCILTSLYQNYSDISNVNGWSSHVSTKCDILTTHGSQPRIWHRHTRTNGMEPPPPSGGEERSPRSAI